jgi:hypothetical protein
MSEQRVESAPRRLETVVLPALEDYARTIPPPVLIIEDRAQAEVAAREERYHRRQSKRALRAAERRAAKLRARQR